MCDRDRFLALDEPALLAQCDVHTRRASGPGGQHRNKVSSAVRLVHRPTGLTANAAESRSQHDNRRRALARLRMALACELRRPLQRQGGDLPPAVRDCLFRPRGQVQPAPRLDVGRKDWRYWPVLAFLLDALEAAEGRLADAAGMIGITTGNLTSILRAERHALAAAQRIRKAHGHPPIA